MIYALFVQGLSNSNQSVSSDVMLCMLSLTLSLPAVFLPSIFSAEIYAIKLPFNYIKDRNGK